MGAFAAVLAGQTPTFHVSTRLIQVNVIVHDRKGDPIRGLDKDQFTLFDQGRAQRIVLFSEQLNQSVAAGDAHAAASGGASVFSNRPQPGDAGAGSATAILFDSLNTDFSDSAFARARVARFLQGIQPGDRIALYGLSSKLLVLHDFTGDAQALVQALDRFTAGDTFETGATKFKESNTGHGAIDAFINDVNQKVSDMNMPARVQSTAAALEAIARHLAGLPGRKNLGWVSGSFPISIGYFQKRLRGARPERETFDQEVQATGRAVSSADVAIYPVDAHALTTLGGVFNAATSPKMGVLELSMSTSRAPDLAPIDDLGTMERLAQATGGRVFANTNDIDGAVRSAIDDSRCTYVLGYYPDHDQWNGEFREIKVQVKRAGAETRYRRGYIAFPDVPLDQNRAPLTAADALAAPLESTELGLTMQIEPQTGPARTREIKAHLRIDTAAMGFEQKDGRWTDDFDYLWVQLGADGGLVASHAQTLTLRLSPQTYQGAAGKGLRMSFTETIANPTVELRFVARDRGTGALGSLKIPLRNVFGQAR